MTSTTPECDSSRGLQHTEQFRAGAHVSPSLVLMAVHAAKRIIPASADVDIAVFETEEKIAQPFQVAVSAQDEGPTMIPFRGHRADEPRRKPDAAVHQAGDRIRH